MQSRERIALRHAVSVMGNVGASETLLFVHGFGTDQQAWRDIMPAFAQDYQLISFDNAGAGRSDPAAFSQPHYLNLQGYVEDVLAICEAYDLMNVTVVGHSMGAMIGAMATLAAPTRFKRLVMIGASPRYLNDGDYHGGFTRKDIDNIYATLLHDFDKWVDTIVPQAASYPLESDVARYFASCLRAVKREHILTILYSILQSDCRKEIRSITVPTLILHTAADAFVPTSVAEFIHESISGSTLTALDVTGHFPHLTHPQLVVTELQSFLAAGAAG